ncbi:MAG TPA: HD domain-containing protein, partial [Anaeromyxobacteraceae bacterium]|nr:HD domain-containing protein [Anaeromyxobacteraceae bacterium]
MSGRSKLFNDPVHGFVSVPRGLILDLVETPAFQRLRRIRQLGLGFLVFPGAVHTRFEHALGAMALMQEALDTLREKGTFMATDEVEAALAAALLHDIGHGPFSHTLEEQLLPPGPDGRPHHHERMSRALIRRLDRRFGGALGLTLEIFDGTYERPFFHTLVASQLDMDRLDYLRRDAFYTGVAEGVVGVERVLKTMRVHPERGGPDSRVVIEAKGAYAVENVILSRRLMFWQVYLHKTVIAADHLLR